MKRSVVSALITAALVSTIVLGSTESVVVENEFSDDSIIIRRPAGERLLLKKWSLSFLLDGSEDFSLRIVTLQP